MYSHQVYNSNVALALGQSWMVIHIHIYPVIMQKCLPFIMYCEVCCQVNCLQTCEFMSAYLAIKVYMFVKFHIHIGCLRLREMCFSKCNFSEPVH